MRFWHKTTAQPWAITDSALATILEIAARQNASPEAVAARLGRQLDNTYDVMVRDCVAILPVEGPLFRHANLFTMISGASSYERLTADFSKAIENPDVNAVVLNIDSPGGEVNGCSELANLIYSARGQKPIIAYASGDCASGAYWIASAADRIVVSDTASLGSIGVVAVYRGAKGESNNKDIEIVSSQSPFKRLDPTKDSDRARIQARVDALAEVFVQAVATHRGVARDTVLKNYGQGDLVIGQTAVERGLADSGGTLEKIISILSANQSSDSSQFQPSNTITSSNLIATSSKPPKLHNPIKHEKNEDTPLDITTLKKDHPDLCQSLIDQGKATGVKDGVTIERERVKAILDSDEAQDKEALARHLAFNTTLSAKDITAALKASTPIAGSLLPKERQSPEQRSGFTQVMSGIENPDIQVGGGDSGENEETEAQMAERIAAYSKRPSNPLSTGGAQ